MGELRDMGQRKTRICIAMLDPAYGGGILTLLRELFPILTGWGVKPELLYLSASDSVLAPCQLLRRFRWWDVHYKTNLGFPGLALGHVPAHFRSLVYFWLYPAVLQYIHEFDMHMVVGGPLRGLTFALAQKPYLIWVGTLFIDEYKARAEVGDDYAREVLASSALPFILWQEKLTLQRASLILAQSQYTADCIASTCPEVSGRIRVVPCPVEIPQLDTNQATTHTTDVICVGRLSDPRKNIDHLLEAFSMVSEEHPGARLLLIGGTEERVTPLRLAELGIQDCVLDLGKVSDAELSAYYREAAVFALPSRQEGLGIVVLEAMAYGVPVVSTRCGGPEDHIVDDKTGFLVGKDDAEAMARAILRLLNDCELRKQMSQAAREHAEKMFSRKVVAAQFHKAFMDVYPDVMGRLHGRT